MAVLLQKFKVLINSKELVAMQCVCEGGKKSEYLRKLLKMTLCFSSLLRLVILKYETVWFHTN